MGDNNLPPLPQFQNYQVRTKVVEALVMVESVKTALEIYHEEHGRWPANNKEAGFRSLGIYPVIMFTAQKLLPVEIRPAG